MTQLNSTPIRKVKLYGKLRRFGNEFYTKLIRPTYNLFARKPIHFKI